MWGEGLLWELLGIYASPLEGSKAFMVIAFREISGECPFAIVA